MTSPHSSRPPADGPLVLAVDQGTSATKAVLVDRAGSIVAHGSAPLAATHPRQGWVEQSPLEIWDSVRESVRRCLARLESPTSVASVGLSTQRESVCLWERVGGDPVGPLLSWQDSRGAARCDRLRAAGHGDRVMALSGLPLDPMFSAAKASWLLDEHDPDRVRSRRGELCLGTVDSWLLSRLGAPHLIESGNAARTQLLELDRGEWSAELLELFDLPLEALPEVRPSAGRFAAADALHPRLAGVPVTAVLGDSHAALFGHAGWRRGQVKVTYGTGSSVMGLVERGTRAHRGVCRTIAWHLDEPRFALEGNIRSTGATLSWLAQLFDTTPGELAARAAASSDGVHLVPAFTGLGAPWWDEQAQAVITGMSQATGMPQLARAALESIAFQIEDVIGAIERDIGPVSTVLADGGPSDNAALMQLQADTSGRCVARAEDRELSALGVAHLAGHAAGVWSWPQLDALPRERTVSTPAEPVASRRDRQRAWRASVARSRGLAVGAAEADGGAEADQQEPVETGAAAQQPGAIDEQ